MPAWQLGLQERRFESRKRQIALFSLLGRFAQDVALESAADIALGTANIHRACVLHMIG